jgi:hypothetical protein
VDNAWRLHCAPHYKAALRGEEFVEHAKLAPCQPGMAQINHHLFERAKHLIGRDTWLLLLSLAKTLAPFC